MPYNNPHPVPTAYYSFETKCRRCNGFHNWASFGYTKETARSRWLDFAELVRSIINEPRQQFCEDCNRETVQDLTSYSPPPENE